MMILSPQTMDCFLNDIHKYNTRMFFNRHSKKQPLELPKI